MADPSLFSRRNPEDEFELIKKVGSGTYGEVYKAKVVKSGLYSALKIINIDQGDDFAIIQQEIQILADCKHANIVAYFGSYLRRDKLWIAMEYCGGGSLQDIYNVTGGLNELQIAYVCRETLQGLMYLHEKNKMHRDIKGANILLTEKGDVKLADFGIAAQITMTLGKRKSFIGTPYWMAPEVAAVEKKGGYDQKCDVWAVGIVAIELAETQPPMFDLHPMRALYLMSKSNFKPPQLKQRAKWSAEMHDFVKCSLKRDSKKRPSAKELLKHPFCDRPLVRELMTNLLHQAMNPEDLARSQDEDEEEDEPHPPVTTSQLRRINSNRHQKPRDSAKPVASDLSVGELNLTPPIGRMQDQNWDMSPHMAGGAGDGFPHQQGAAAASAGSSVAASPMGQAAPPLPPRPRQSTGVPTPGGGTPAMPPPTEPAPPRPPKQATTRPTPVAPSVSAPSGANDAAPPPLPERKPTQRRPTQQVRGETTCFSKIFSGCPLNIHCASSWLEPTSRNQHILLGAEEGLYTLNLNNQGVDVAMEQVYPRKCTWLFVVHNVLVSISGAAAHLCMTDLVQIHDKGTDGSAKSNYGSRRRFSHTTKVPDSRGSLKCCVARNPFSDQQYLCAATARSIILMQWYEPLQKFMLVKTFESQLPSPLNVFEPFVVKTEEYPIICVGVMKGEGDNVQFDTINLNSTAMWFPNNDPQISIKTLCQLEKDTLVVAYEDSAKFVNLNGQMKQSTRQASILTFEPPPHHIVCLQGSVLSFHRHGMLGKSLSTRQVIAQVTDPTRVFRLLGSDRVIIIESRMVDDVSAASNLYILAGN